jgi:hypothetical protein
MREKKCVISAGNGVGGVRACRRSHDCYGLTDNINKQSNKHLHGSGP